MDKTTWGDGPWQQEPDRDYWEYKGVPCLVVRVEHGGHWCGYAAVPEGHPWHGKSYSDESMWNVNVHGGLTYGAVPCTERVCHPSDGEDNVHWFGFDCAHSGDYMPALGARFSLSTDDSYRDMQYVKAEVERLADQILAAAA